jgi:hypothetical protein
MEISNLTVLIQQIRKDFIPRLALSVHDSPSVTMRVSAYLTGVKRARFSWLCVAGRAKEGQQ